MEDFPKYYKILFNAMTDAIKELEACNYGNAIAHLRRGQVESESAFLEDTDGYDDPELKELARRAMLPDDEDLFEDEELPYV